MKVLQFEVMLAQGWSFQEAVRQIDATTQTDYRWHKEYDGMTRDQFKRLKVLETENQCLKRFMAEISLNKLILTEAARGTLGPRWRNF